MNHHAHARSGKRYLRGCAGCQQLAREHTAKYKDHPRVVLARRIGNWKALGIDVEQATAELALGKTICDGCSRPANGNGALHIDHDHDTGRVRGSLCFSCNLILGHAHDSPERLQALIDYLGSPE